MTEPQTTKLYVVIGGTSYEGYCMPRGVFSSLEEARKFSYPKDDHDEWVDIIEYEIDQLAKQPKKVERVTN